MGERGFEGVVGAEHVDVDDGFEGVGAALRDGREEVARGSGADGCAPPLVSCWLRLAAGAGMRAGEGLT